MLSIYIFIIFSYWIISTHHLIFFNFLSFRLKIVKISFKSKQFFIQLRKELVSMTSNFFFLSFSHFILFSSHSIFVVFPPSQSENPESLLGFNMMNYRACKNIWKACVEHHTFFRLERPVPPERNLFLQYFTLGSKYRYWWDV